MNYRFSNCVTEEYYAMAIARFQCNEKWYPIVIHCYPIRSNLPEKVRDLCHGMKQVLNRLERQGYVETSFDEALPELINFPGDLEGDTVTINHIQECLSKSLEENPYNHNASFWSQLVQVLVISQSHNHNMEEIW